MSSVQYCVIDGMGINVIMEYVTEHGPRGMCVWRPSVYCVVGGMRVHHWLILLFMIVDIMEKTLECCLVVKDYWVYSRGA